jgi:hypothetical protein
MTEKNGCFMNTALGYRSHIPRASDPDPAAAYNVYTVSDRAKALADA